MNIAGIDVGTTGCKIVVYNGHAELLNTYYREYDVVRSCGQHEIDFETVKENVLAIIRSAVSDYTIGAIGVTSFGETFAMLDENDAILAPSMLYTDPRGEAECEMLCRAIGKEKLTAITGVEPHQMYSISKMMWLKNNRPEAFGKAKHILLGEDFIIYTLTGVARIDYSLAARTAAFDITEKQWCDEILATAGIDPSLLSEPVPTGSVAGKITDEMKLLLGIDYDITVINGAHDQVAAMIGSGVFDSGVAMDGTGTVECMPVVLEEIPKSTQVYRGGYSVVPYYGGKYACYALAYAGGATLKWFRDNFAEAEKSRCAANGGNVYALLDEKIPPEPTGILVLPHFAGAATPYMDANAKASFTGITFETTKYDLYKALMEGTSYEILLNFEILQQYAGEISAVRATGGGAASDVWLQIKADVLDMAVTALDCKEIGAAGTAALAGTAIGIFDDLPRTVEKMSGVRKIFMPNPANAPKYRALFRKYRNLYTAIKSL